MDPYNRIQEHLGIALRKLSILETRGSAGQDRAQDVGHILAELQRVAQELDQAFSAVKWERQRVTNIAGEAEASLRLARKLFVESASACIVVRRDCAVIEEANAAASRLLNVSQRHLIGKPFTHFLQQDREMFLRQLQQDAETAADQWHVTLRPRERAVMQVLVNAIVNTEATTAIVLSPPVNGRSTADPSRDADRRTPTRPTAHPEAGIAPPQ